jgi:hypothetical protein
MDRVPTSRKQIVIPNLIKKKKKIITSIMTNQTHLGHSCLRVQPKTGSHVQPKTIIVLFPKLAFKKKKKKL